MFGTVLLCSGPSPSLLATGPSPTLRSEGVFAALLTRLELSQLPFCPPLPLCCSVLLMLPIASPRAPWRRGWSRWTWAPVQTSWRWGPPWPWPNSWQSPCPFPPWCPFCWRLFLVALAFPLGSLVLELLAQLVPLTIDMASFWAPCFVVTPWQQSWCWVLFKVPVVGALIAVR